jgi:hypothetical protein
MISQWFSVTRTIGLAAYTVSLLACLMRLARCYRDSQSRRIFAVLAGVQLALLLDMAFDWRWKLHDYGMRTAMVGGIYGERRAPQLLILVILAAILLACCSAILYRLRHRRGLGLTLASIGTMLSLGLWCSEALSYHFFDQVLYRTVGKAMLVSFLWCGLAALTCFGAWTADLKRRRDK